MILILFLCMLVSQATFANGTWWQTADQKGATLLKEGHTLEASKTFENKRWQASALYRAGQYKEAANSFAQFKDVDAYYNLGNSLAKQHQYKKAIKAYDKTLALNPNHADAKYNRDLLKKLLEDNKNKDQNKQDKQDKQKNKDKDKKDNKDPSKQQDKNNNNGQDKDKQPQTPKDNKTDNKPGNQPNNLNGDKDKQSQQKKADDGKASEKKSQGKPQDATSSNDPGQKSKGHAKPHTAPQPSGQSKLSKADKQWLNKIPDNPGELLRQKFLRDYWRRHAR